MTVKDVKKMLKGLPDDTPVLLFNGVGRGDKADENVLYVGTVGTHYKDVERYGYTLHDDNLYYKETKALIIHAVY